MTEKTKLPVKPLSELKDELLLQTLRQVKHLKARLDSDNDETLSLQQAVAEIEYLKERVHRLENDRATLQQSLLDLKIQLQSVECTHCSDEGDIMQQIAALRREVQALKEEPPSLKDRTENTALGTAKETELRQLRIGVPTSKTEITISKEPIVQEPTVVAEEGDTTTKKLLSPEEKVALFEELFAWRRNVFAERWENQQTGENGYKPARKHDYAAHYSGGKKTTCPGAPRCTDTALTRETLKNHLQGKLTIGVYPMLDNDTCMFLAIDLDEKHQGQIVDCSTPGEPWLDQVPAPQRELENRSPKNITIEPAPRSWSWHEDARALIDAACRSNVPAYLERSRSGKGGHVWIFFTEPVPAAMARRLGEFLVTRAQRDSGLLSLRSYDRMFPNQDTLPRKGYGNLIALPLQKGPLANGNSAFVDENMVPYSDQWGLLQAVKKMSASHVHQTVEEAARQNSLMCVDQPNEKEEDDEKIDPWALPASRKKKEAAVLLPPHPPSVTIKLCNFVYVPKKELTRGHLNVIERLAAFQNPLFQKNQRLRLSNYKTPRVISCTEEFKDYLALPRGCLVPLQDLFARSGVSFNIEDLRFPGRQISAGFNGELRDDQKESVAQLLKADFGILCAVPGFGKTVIAAYCIAQRQVNTLVLVHRQQLLRQWKERLTSFLNLPPSSIGEVGGGKKKTTGIIDIAMVQSLNKSGEVDDLVAQYGQVIVDECHGVGSVDFEQVLRQVKAKFVLGLTATPVRYDGHHPIIVMQCGPIRHRVRHSDIDTGIAEHIVLPRFTKACLPEHADNYGVQEIIGELTNNEQRNQLIVNDVLQALAENRTPIVLTKRKDHLQILHEKLEGKVKNIVVFQGGLGLKKLSKLTDQLKSIPEGEQRVVLAIGQCIGEGFDDSRLDTLFLAMPISFRGRLEQYVGRLHRAHEGKSMVKIYDYVDFQIEAMHRMYKKRQTGYKQIGYTIALPV